MARVALLFAFGLGSGAGYGQVGGQAELTFREHFNRALKYNSLSILGPSIEQLKLARSIALERGLNREAMEAGVQLAEVYRKTRGYDESLKILRSLTESSAYPELHVKKLGRIAAVYNEIPEGPPGLRPDSILLYLDSALAIAESLDLKSELASLYNELGYTLSNGNWQEGVEYLHQSARLYGELRDTHNYVRVKTNILRGHFHLRHKQECQELMDELVPLVQGRPWYIARYEIVAIVSAFYEDIEPDSAKQMYWHSRVLTNAINQVRSSSEAQVVAYKELYEIERFRQEAAEAEQQAFDRKKEVEREEERSRQLTRYLSILGGLGLIFGLFLFRERRFHTRLKLTNHALNESNEKYHMLVVESNHRIKNNLQMVISMLQYSQSTQDESGGKAVDRLSAKIQTISALHRHLSVEEHNELVRLDTYVKEIVELYQDIAPGNFVITATIAPVEIRSERIIYFGLIINEMLANTLEHGSDNGSTIHLGVTQQEGGYHFIYEDGSVYEYSAGSGTGSMLILQLIERVGGTRFTFESEAGRYAFEFGA